MRAEKIHWGDLVRLNQNHGTAKQGLPGMVVGTPRNFWGEIVANVRTLDGKTIRSIPPRKLTAPHKATGGHQISEGDLVKLNQNHGTAKQGVPGMVVGTPRNLWGEIVANVRTPDGKTIRSIPPRKLTKK